ncbi:ABC transporter permease [Yinghuangia sp. YIM S09857]|uniref:ABC transporter permease n=1 Tax=Yinghuangia sp. YIM S09857 TaxID=3436929 RepID=UPI003F52F26E
MSLHTTTRQDPVETVFVPETAPAGPTQWMLTKVELRKMTDTRSGRWVLAVIVLAMVGMVCLLVFAGEDGDRDVPELFLASQLGLSVLLPVIGILSVTAEWSQRSGLSTFALVPKRHRVVFGKFAAGVIIAVAGMALSTVVTYGGHALALATDNAEGGWGVPADLAATRLLDCVVAVATGIAFGMLLSSPMLSVLAFYAIPIVLGILGSTVSALEAPFRWINPGEAMTPLSEHDEISALEWSRALCNTAFFGVALFAAGLYRTSRREVT